MLVTKLVFATWLAQVAASSDDSSSNSDKKNGNLRPSLAVSDSDHRRLEDGLVVRPIDDDFCEMGVCDAALDPVTVPQFKIPHLAPLNKTSPFCINFNNASDTEGFAPCPGHYDNIEVNVYSTASPDDPINPLRGDFHLHLRDRSGGSLACGTGAEYTGDWTAVADKKCYQLCWDVGLFFDGCLSTAQTGCVPGANGGFYKEDLYPMLILQGGGPNYYRAAFRADQHMTDPDGDSPGWRRICAPLTPLNAEGDLPKNEYGQWYMAAPNHILSGLPPVPGSPSPNYAWNDLLSDVTAIELPVDFTSNPAERIGYDHICLEEGDCHDTCDPEPLCHWKNNWKCENIKKEDWFLKFNKLIAHVDTFDIRHLCVCDVLNQCCPDLCDFAEQEFLALLLNVASGQVDLDCGVKECDDCVHTVQEIIQLVDDLLAQSSRSDHDCSRALQFLTGINQDEILCDSTGDCPLSERCRLSGGLCVKKRVCEKVYGVDCLDDYCEKHDCSCMIFNNVTKNPTDEPSLSPTDRPTGSPVASPNPTDRPTVSPTDEPTLFPTPRPVHECVTTPECEDAGGECVENCYPIFNSVACDPNLCREEDCVCRIDLNRPCKQTERCEARKGKCVKSWDCVGNCDDTLCDLSEDCVCQMEDNTLPCETNEKCKQTGTGGVCTRDCKPIRGILQCANDICDEPDCYCKNCLQNDVECSRRGGQCMLPEVCEDVAANDPTLECHREFCGGPNNICTCLVPTPPCPLTDECLQADGACVRDCVDTDEFACGQECKSNECRCLKCRPTDLCMKMQGKCVPFCVPGPNEVCDTRLCDRDDNLDNSPCACKYRLDFNYNSDVGAVDAGPVGIGRIP